MAAKKIAVADVEKEINRGAESITIDGKDFDEVREILDSYDFDYAWDTFKKGKEYKFHIFYED